MAKMKQFDVEVEKLLCQKGTISVRAISEEAAEKQVKAMMVDPNDPLQTNDKRIDWGNPEYVDFSFTVDGSEDDEEEA